MGALARSITLLFLYLLALVSLGSGAIFEPEIGISLAFLSLIGVRYWVVVPFLHVLISGFLEQPWGLSSLDAGVVSVLSFFAFQTLKRYHGGERPLSKVGQVARFLTLTGPALGLLGAVLTVGARAALGLRPELSWGAYFVDKFFALTLGVVVTYPWLLATLSPQLPWRRRRLSVALPTFILILLAFFGRALVHRGFAERMRVSTAQLADQTTRDLTERLERYGALVEALSTFVQTRAYEPEEFSDFAEGLANTEPEALSFAYIPGTMEAPLGGLMEGDTVLVLVAPVLDSSGGVSGRVEGVFSLEELRQVWRVKPDEGLRANLSVQVNGRLLELPQDSPRGDADRYLTSREVEGDGTLWRLDFELWPRAEIMPKVGLPVGLLVFSGLQFLFILLSSRAHRVEVLRGEMEAKARELSELNRDLEQATAAAQRADLAKGRFLAGVSHEIRTPMNGIIGLAGLLLDSGVKPAQEEQLRHLLSSADALLALLNDVLDFSKLEADGVTLEPLTNSLSTILEQALRGVLIPAEEKGLELRLEVEPGCPELLVFDPSRLRQVLLNLLSNAVKFTEEGEVLLKVQHAMLSEGSTVLSFAVSDTGPGISEEQQELIFQPFTQAEDSSNKKGTGLGLSIARDLVELMGGSIQLESRLGEGSTFSFQLLCSNPELDPPFQSIDEQGGGLEALPIFLGQLSEGKRAHWTTHIESWDGVLVSEPSQAELMILREDELATQSFSKRVVAVLSASALVEGFESCERHGALPLAEPVSPRSLHQAVLQAIGKMSRLQEGDRSCSLGVGRRALVVDDNLTNQLLASSLLKGYGFSVDCLGDGELAVRAVREQPYDLILMDIRMSGLDGLEASRRIRELGVRAPILAVTAYISEEKREQAASLGIERVLRKPLEERVLREALQECLPEVSTFCPQHLLKAVGGKRDVALAVIEGFLSEISQLTARIQKAQGPAQMNEATHALRGALSVFGETRTVALLERMDQSLEAEAMPKLSEVESLLQRVGDFRRELVGYQEKNRVE